MLADQSYISLKIESQSNIKICNEFVVRIIMYLFRQKNFATENNENWKIEFKESICRKVLPSLERWEREMIR